MNSLRTIFRWMLLVWLVLVAALGFTVSRSTESSYLGNTMAFLFSGAGREEADLAPHERRPSAPREEPPAAPETPEWTALASGKTMGKGSLGTPEVQELPDGSIAVVFPLTGEPGGATFFRPGNVTSATIDLHGEWTSLPYMKQRVKSGCLSLIQSAGHKGYLRVSGVAAGDVAKLDAKAEHSASGGAVRVVFSPSDGGKAE